MICRLEDKYNEYNPYDEQIEDLKKEALQDERDRNAIEGKFGQAKR